MCIIDDTGRKVELPFVLKHHTVKTYDGMEV
jgi:hypothetical protein